MRTIEISEETYEKIKDQLGKDDVEVLSYNDFVGKSLFLRTVTYHHVGKVVRKIGDFLELKDASWVADSGRFMDAIKYGKLDEVEPVGQAWVNIKSAIDIIPWRHKLPTEQK